MKHNNVIKFPTRSALEDRHTPARPKKQTSPRLNDFDVWKAIDQGRIAVHYQPQFDLQTGELIAAESLVRLIDEAGGLILPPAFTAVVERSPLVAPLGRKIIARTCHDFAEWRDAGATLRHVSINLSATQLEVDQGLLAFIDRVLSDCGLEYGDIEFALTERQHLQADSRGILVLRELAERGARLAIDDYGVGYGSNLYLAQLPISSLKLDIEATASVIDRLLCVATDLGIEVVARGIETRDQQDRLTEMGCRFGQGGLFAPPADAGQFFNATVQALPTT